MERRSNQMLHYDYESALISFSDYKNYTGTDWFDFLASAASKTHTYLWNDHCIMQPKTGGDEFNTFMHNCTGKKTMTFLECVEFFKNFIEDFDFTDFGAKFQFWTLKASDIEKGMNILQKSSNNADVYVILSDCTIYANVEIDCPPNTKCLALEDVIIRQGILEVYTQHIDDRIFTMSTENVTGHIRFINDID